MPVEHSPVAPEWPNASINLNAVHEAALAGKIETAIPLDDVAEPAPEPKAVAAVAPVAPPVVTFPKPATKPDDTAADTPTA
jgi:hypothetical protein